MVARGWLVIWVGAALTFGGGTARAENLDAGKSAPALFAATCAACHASPKGLARNTSGSLASYLREHYTASPESAATLAAYLTANAGDPRAKPAPAGARAATGPSEGTPGAKHRPGQTAQPPAAKTEPPARPPQTATARPDSMIEPVDPRRHHEESAKGAKGKRQPSKQETTAAPPSGAPEPAAPSPSAAPAAAPPPAAAPVAAAPPPDQPAFSAPSP